MPDNSDYSSFYLHHALLEFLLKLKMWILAMRLKLIRVETGFIRLEMSTFLWSSNPECWWSGPGLCAIFLVRIGLWAIISCGNVAPAQERVGVDGGPLGVLEQLDVETVDSKI
jgi:hypothetical protein